MSLNGLEETLLTTKRCSKCEEIKTVNDFYKQKNGFRSRCKTCMNEERKKYGGRWKDIKASARKYIWEFKKSHPCVKCGEADPIVLIFDHLDTSKKEFEISNSNGDLELLKKEIDKCQVLCSNCHARRTADQYGWYKEFVEEV